MTNAEYPEKGRLSIFEQITLSNSLRINNRNTSYDPTQNYCPFINSEHCSPMEELRRDGESSLRFEELSLWKENVCEWGVYDTTICLTKDDLMQKIGVPKK